MLREDDELLEFILLYEIICEGNIKLVADRAFYRKAII